MIILKVLLSIVCVFLISILFLWVSTLFIDRNKTYDTDSKYYRWLLNAWSGFAILILRIHIMSNGLDRIPEGRFLLVQNHRSNYDPILTWYVLRKSNLSFISKKENFNIPFFGKLIHRCCFREIDRENLRNAIRTICDAAELLADDKVSMGVYPEGTRNKHSEEEALLPFHNGVFKIAQRANVPIVVTTIKGTEKIYKNIPFHRSYVEFDVLDVILPEEIKKERTDAIGERVEELMREKLASGMKKSA